MHLVTCCWFESPMITYLTWCYVLYIRTSSMNDIAMGSCDQPAEGSCPPLDRRVHLPYLHGNLHVGSCRPGAVSRWCEWFLLAKSSSKFVHGNCRGNLQTIWFTIFRQLPRSCTRKDFEISWGVRFINIIVWEWFWKQGPYNRTSFRVSPQHIHQGSGKTPGASFAVVATPRLSLPRVRGQTV